MSSLLSGLASNAASGQTQQGQGVPGAPDNARAAAALAAGILALHAFLRVEQDPADRAAVTTCLAKLEQIRGKKVGAPVSNQQAGPPGLGGPPQSGGSPGGNIPGY